MLTCGYRKFTALCATATVFMLFAGTAQAASVEYPQGGSSFSGGAEGWEATEATCSIPVLCTSSGGYDGAIGNPAGSLAANTNIALNVVSLFKSSVTFASPDFKVEDDGTTTVHVDRQFSQGNLVDLSPSLAYTVRVIDRTAGTTRARSKRGTPMPSRSPPRSPRRSPEPGCSRGRPAPTSTTSRWGCSPPVAAKVTAVGAEHSPTPSCAR